VRGYDRRSQGVAAKVFGILGDNRVNVLMISQSSSEANISFIVQSRELEHTVNLLELSLLGRGVVRNNIGGKRMRNRHRRCGMRGLQAWLRGSLGLWLRRGINVRMIAQGSSELNISFVVKEEDGVKAVRKLHREFQLH